MALRCSRGKVPVLLIAMVGSVVLGLATAFGTYVVQFRRELNAEIDLIALAGEPTTSADVSRLGAQPAPNQDATALWLAAIEELHRKQNDGDMLTTDDIPWPTPGQPWSSKQRTEALLKSYREPIDMFYCAAAHGGIARFPLDFAGGSSVELPHLSTLRQGAILLAIDAAVKSRRGDTDGSFLAVSGIFAVALSLKEEPLAMSQMVRRACDSIAINALERVLCLTRFSDEQLMEIRNSLARIEYDRALRKIVLTERAMTIDLLLSADPLATTLSDAVGSAAEPPGNGWRFQRMHDLAAYLRHVRPLAETTRLSGESRRVPLEKAERQLFWFRMSGDVRPTWATYCTAPIIVAIEQCQRADSQVLTADTAVAALLFCRKNGQLPMTLEELIPAYFPEPQRDPFDGEPLRYNREPAGFAVYSIGPDRTDEHGSRYRGANAPFDVGFYVDAARE